MISNITDGWRKIDKFWLIDIDSNKHGYAKPIWDDDSSEEDYYEGIIGWTWTNEGPSWEDLVNVASEVFVADRTSGDIFEVEDWMRTNELSSDIASAVEEMNDGN